MRLRRASPSFPSSSAGLWKGCQNTVSGLDRAISRSNFFLPFPFRKNPWGICPPVQSIFLTRPQKPSAKNWTKTEALFNHRGYGLLGPHPLCRRWRHLPLSKGDGEKELRKSLLPGALRAHPGLKHCALSGRFSNDNQVFSISHIHTRTEV